MQRLVAALGKRIRSQNPGGEQGIQAVCDERGLVPGQMPQGPHYSILQRLARQNPGSHDELGQHAAACRITQYPVLGPIHGTAPRREGGETGFARRATAMASRTVSRV